MSRPHRVLVSWSTGKDSAWMLHLLRKRGDVEVVGLATTVEGGEDRADGGTVSGHGVRADWALAQAAAAELPIRLVELPRRCPDVVYRERVGRAFEDARSALGAEVVAFGDLFLADVRRWREGLAASAGLAPAFPLWERPTADRARELCAAQVGAVLVAVDRTRLPRTLVGRAFDDELLSVLPDGIDPCGENGEFHTLVWNCPAFALTCATTAPRVQSVGDDGIMEYAHLAPPGPLRMQASTW